MKFSGFLAMLLAARALSAQEPKTPDVGEAPYTPATLATEFLEHNFFNVYAFANGTYDTNGNIYGPTAPGQAGYGSGTFGYELGGGINASHEFRHAILSLGYRGDYRNYQNELYGAGNSQNLSLSYAQRLTRRWSFNTSIAAGILLYGGTTFAPTPGGGTAPVTTNPFSPQTRFLTAAVGASYIQSRRLSYNFSGNLFIQRYNYPGAIGTTGGAGSVGVAYRTSPRITIGANYVHSYFKYQHNEGSANIDTINMSISRVFTNHWVVAASGGYTRANTAGVALVPVSLIINGQAVGGYVLGAYNQVTGFPSFNVSVSKNYRRDSFSVSGGQGAASGNGYYLTSKQIYFGGAFSHSMRRSNISATAGYYRLSSIANTVSTSFSSASVAANYGINLMKYFGANARYEYNHYGNLGAYSGISDNRISFGFYFSSKSIPMTLY